MALRPIEEALYSTHIRGPLVDIGVPLEQGRQRVWHAPLGITEPFNGDDEGLWEKLHLLEFMALLMGQTS